MYQIEVDIHKGGLQWGPCGNDGWTVEQYKQKKFDQKTKDFIRKTFGVKKSKDVWVCWGIHPKVRKSALQAAARAEIEIWEFKDKIREFLEAIGTGHYGDDIIKTLSY